MASTQNTASPRAPRAKHQHSKSATQAPLNTNGKQGARRHKGNRANNCYNAHNGNGAGASPSKFPANADPAFVDSAILSGEDLHMPAAPRNAKKHTQSQSSSEPVFSPTAVPVASLTDSELPPNPSATPAKAQAAYAGPTFHASPAPSALPMPTKFLSKSVPAKTRQGPPTPPPDESSDSAVSPSPSPPSPSRAPIPIPPRHEDSPLDMLFRADRAERAKNANGSPASASFSNSPNPSSANGKLQHSKQDSYSSLNAVFPIELDGESKKSHPSPPAASPAAHRSITAPSKIPQIDDSAKPNDGSDALQDLFHRLSMSQKKSNESTPPRPVDHVPSDPSSRKHTPSPFHDGRSVFRSASGPTTPAPAAQEASDFFYGNKNLSPLFKAARGDSAKRNSRLRTEVTADSPIMPQGEFPLMSAPKRMDGNTASRNALNNVIDGPLSPRRGSAPHIQPYREMPNNRKTRTPGRRSYQPRPDSYPHGNSNSAANAPTNGPPASMPKACTTMSFMPSSVRAKQHSTTPPTTTTTKSDPLSLEQDLKRLLNVKIGDTAGVV